MSDNDNNTPDNPIAAEIKKARKPKVEVLNFTAIKNANADLSDWQRQNGDYQVIHNCFYQVKVNRKGDPVKIKLCNFTCEILEETIHEDGLVDKAYFRITGKREDGTTLPDVEVSLTKFPVMNWPGELLGSRALIYSGTTKRDNLRVAIILYSTRNGEIRQRRIFGYTGWTRIDDQWRYLTGSGAIGANGLDTSVQVDLGGGHMSRYSLPEPPTPKQLKSDLAALDTLLTICPHRQAIGAILIACIARAPLGECHPIDFIAYLQGSTGNFKSSLAALLQGCCGNFDARSFPANFTDSDSDLEAKAHQAKESIFTIDDHKPAVNALEASKQKAKLERFIRNTGNQAGRGRRNTDMTIRPAPFNRSLTIMTGENALNCGQSIDARMLNIEIRPNDVNVETLSRLQQAARDGAFMRIMAAYISNG